MGQAVVTLGVDMDRVRLSVPADPRFHGALRLVVGGIGSRLQLPYEQVNELQLAVEALVSHRVVVGDEVCIEAEIDEHSVALSVGPFEPDGDEGGRRVLERLVEATRTIERNGSGQWVELRVRRGGSEVKQ